MNYKEFFEKEMSDEEFAKAWWDGLPSLEVAHLLIGLREQLDLTQEQLAEKAGVKAGYIARLESGDANPTVRKLGQVLGALDMRLDLAAKPRQPRGGEVEHVSET